MPHGHLMPHNHNVILSTFTWLVKQSGLHHGSQPQHNQCLARSAPEGECTHATDTDTCLARGAAHLLHAQAVWVIYIQSSTQACSIRSCYVPSTGRHMQLTATQSGWLAAGTQIRRHWLQRQQHLASVVPDEPRFPAWPNPTAADAWCCCTIGWKARKDSRPTSRPLQQSLSILSGTGVTGCSYSNLHRQQEITPQHYMHLCGSRQYSTQQALTLHILWARLTPRQAEIVEGVSCADSAAVSGACTGLPAQGCSQHRVALKPLRTSLPNAARHPESLSDACAAPNQDHAVLDIHTHTHTRTHTHAQWVTCQPATWLHTASIKGRAAHP